MSAKSEFPSLANQRRPGHLRPFILLPLAVLAGARLAGAATVWTGPPIAWSYTNGIDRVTTNVWLTRGTTNGLYNAAQESKFTHFLSPTNTEWANGTTAEYATLTYADWDSWAKLTNGGPPFTVGVPAVVHLIQDDIYIDVTFLSWSTGGPYSYQRSTPTPPRFDSSSLTPVDGQFPLTLSVTPGSSYEIDWTSTFTNWNVLTNFLATNTTMTFTTPATGACRAFKAWLMTNP